MNRTWTRSRLLLVAAASLLLAGPVQADIKDFIHYCSSGALRTCASVQIETIPLAGGGTGTWIRIRNLQGTLATDNTEGSLITKLGLTAPTITGASSLSVVTTAPAERIIRAGGNAPESYWSITNEPIGGQITFSTGINGVNGAIQGCDASNANPKSYFRTCGDDGWIAFYFTTTNNWAAADAEIAWGVQAVGPGDASFQCRTEDPDCTPGQDVVPEPASMILLGSGLAGLRLMRRRRRAPEVDSAS